jgi:glycosyltransferase involved in cell wall biosynthesis
MKIIIIIPVYYREKFLEESLKSLLNTDISGVSVSVCLGINGQTVSLMKIIDGLGKEFVNRGFEYSVYNPGKNIGKPRITNEISKMNYGYEYLVSMDSDIVITKIDWLLNLLYTFNHFSYSSPLGALCANQTGKNCHVLDIDPISIQAGKFTVITRVGNQGVAGGLLCTPAKVWASIGGFHAHRIYASDDGHYANSCSMNGLVMGMVKEIEVYHPHETDAAYLDWKVRACQDRLLPHELKGHWE